MAVLHGYFPPLIIHPSNLNKPSPLQINLKSRNPILSISKNTCRCQTETTTFYTSTSEDDDDYYEEDEDNDDVEESPPGTMASSSNRRAPLLKRRKRYRKAYPGESKGIAEEMRFVAMKLKNSKSATSNSNSDSDCLEERDGGDSVAETWMPSMEGFAKHLVDCKAVFGTLERVVEKSDDVAYAYFRKTGLERSEGLARDIEWLRERDVEIPEPGIPGASYAKYLEELSTASAPLFLTHFYNVYFSHVAGGQVVVKQVSEKLLDGRELEFCRWDGDAQELLKEVKNKLNSLAEHWSRSDKNKCLSEASKAFKYMGQIVRLIIL